MKNILLLGILACLLGSGCSREKVEEPVTFAATFGVWAGRDCELVRTGDFSLLFWRESDRLSALLTAHSLSGDSIEFDMRGMAVLDTVNASYAAEIKDLAGGGDILGAIDSAGMIDLRARACFFEDLEEKYVLTCDLEIIEEYLPERNRLKVQLPDGTWQTMKLIEPITVVEPYEMKRAGKGSVGECLQEWSLGTDVVQREEGQVTGITIGTNRHVYVFMIGNMIYCRAARIGSNNHGSVFAQNIRMMVNANEFTAAMDENNLAVSETDVAIADSLFDPKICIYADEGIYWSLKSVADSLIVLNGCGGEDYQYQPSALGNEDKLEWFEYVAYEKAAFGEGNE